MRHISSGRCDRFRGVTNSRWLALALFSGLGIATINASAQISYPAVGNIATIAGNHVSGYSGDGGPATRAELTAPAGIAVDGSGNLYFADTWANVVRKVTASTGIITTVAGTGTGGYSGDGGAAISAELSSPDGLALDAAGNIYIADSGNNVVRKVTTSGTITTIAGIPGTADYYGDGGAATSAALSDPEAVAFDTVGNLYIADTGNSVIRTVDLAQNIISTVAGNGVAGFSGDGNQATAAELNGPNGVEVDANGNLFISDSINNRIREVTASNREITTIVGNGTAGYAGDGGPASSAELNLPLFIALDSADNVYIADYNGNAIREVAASTGIISSVAGSGVYGYTGDGGPAKSATLNGPVGVTVDNAGHLYFTDWSNFVVRVVTLSPSPIAVTISPTAETLYADQVARFTASATNASNTALTWSISPAGVGTIDTFGLYTAPATFTSQETVTVTATSQADPTKSASATVTLIPVAVSISPTSVVLGGGQTSEFHAGVSNNANTVVNWSISPTGVGTIDTNGLYTAPASLQTPQTVTVTATSEADSSKSASASITVTPPCSSNGYSYERSIVIDHTKVPNSDQTDFPMLFSSTDPMLASISNGGHLTSPNGYDLIFAADAACSTKLSFERESWNPTSGQLISWVKLPVLSHSVDTVVYLCYGNSGVTASQEDPTGVWNDGYAAVYHLPNGTTLSTSNSASGANDLANNGVGATTGEVGGGASFSGSQYAYTMSAASLPTAASSRTLSAWVQFTSNNPNEEIAGWGDNSADGDRWSLWWGNNQIGIEGRNASAMANMPFDTNWHYIVATSAAGNQLFTRANVYIDGVIQPLASTTGVINTTGTNLALGSIPGALGTDNFKGNLDEVRISSVVRTSDWIAAEYVNQSAPSTFYSLSLENTIAINPGGVSLYASQSQQFAATPFEDCSAGITWSLNPAGVGTLAANGLYTAPSTITTAQTVSIIATNQSNPAETGNALVHLLPAPLSTGAHLSLVAASPSPYPQNTSQNFAAALTDQNGNPVTGVPIAFTVAGANPNSATIATDSNGIAAFSYTGGNSGNDTIQADTGASNVSAESNVVAVSWAAPPPANSAGIVTIETVPQLGLEGLVGAFTDSSGSVIEPLAIGADRRVYVVPVGATQLQLGIDDGYNADNWGPGFVVNVNDVAVTVPAGALPWLWVNGGLNSNYEFGVQDGSNPVIAASNLVAGQTIVVAYQSGLNSPGGPYPANYDANGVPTVITGTKLGRGTYAPTYYMSMASYPVGQSAPVTVSVQTLSGSPMQNVAVLLNVSGANPAQLQAVTDSTGTASFAYIGTHAGNDILKAEAIPSGETAIESEETSIGWVSPSNQPAGTITLTPTSVSAQPVGGAVSFTIFAADSFGNAVTNQPVSLIISGADQMDLSGTTDSTGHAIISYHDINPGTASVFAVTQINGLEAQSSAVNVPWTNAPTNSTATGGSSTLNVSASAEDTVTLPSTLQINGTANDSNLPTGSTIATVWTTVSGPGTVSFANSQQATTTASFGKAGNYLLQFAATDPNGTVSVQIAVTVNPEPPQVQGWIAQPFNGSAVSGIVKINLASGVTLQSGVLSYYPANNLNDVVVLNSSPTSGTIGTLDTTTLPNGSYWIELSGTDSTGTSQDNLALVTVSGNFKPGRVTATVTDLVMPANGLAIQIQRRYDSLYANTSSDFGYGWSLGTNVDLSVDPNGNVTFTLGGIRRTFYLTPTYAYPFPWYFPAFTPEPGLHGTLTDSAEGCSLDVLVPDGSLWECADGTGYYNPPGYIYTDPTGTNYTISANGSLQSITDKNGNTLTIGASGITSSTGLNVPFVRDSQGRITQITDPQGNQYHYGYDSNGNLVSVTYPQTATSQVCSGATSPNTSQYSYYPNAEHPDYPAHYYAGGTDARCYSLPSTTFYSSGEMDTSGTYSVAGKLESVTDGLGETTSYAYDLSTNTTTVTYPDSSTATMTYDSSGDLISATDPLGNTTKNVYDSNDNLTSTTDPLGNIACYTYDSNGNRTSASLLQAGPTCSTVKNTTAYNQFSEPVSTTDELGNVRNFTYDVNYNPQSVTDPLGTLASFIFNSNGTMAAGAIGYDLSQQPTMSSQFSYDSNGNMINRTDALRRTTSYTYDSLGHKRSMTIPLPNSNTSTAAATTSYTYDALGSLTETDAPVGRTTKSSYDANGNKISDTDANGNVTQYQYDALNRLIETDYPDKTSTKRSYDFRGDVVDAIDQAGNDTHYDYDKAGHLTTVTQNYGGSNPVKTTYAYDADGRKRSETDPDGHTTNYTYDNAGNLLSISGPKGNFQYTYDNARNRVSMTDGNRNTTQYKYDARKRLTETDYPDNTKVMNAYDGPGNLVKVVDQANNEIDYTYDAANQLTTVVQVDSPNTGNNTNVYGYDPDGNLISLTDENAHTTQNAYNLLYELTGTTLPDGSSTETRQYDTAGNLISLTHFSGKTTSFTYDSMNRLLSRAPDPSTGERTESFTYTATGKRQTMTDASGTTHYTYDSLDRLITKATPQGTLNYAYDSAGNLASMTSSDGVVNVSYAWDNLNRLSTVTDSRLGGSSNVTTYGYDTVNNLVTVTYPNSLQSTFQYDSLNRLTSMTAANTAYGYTLGPTGIRIQALETSGRTLNWSFDGIYRLTGETVSGDQHYNGSVGYGLDPVSNRLSANSTLHGVNSGGFSYNADDELSGELYGVNGNVTASGGKSFGYDSQNRLTSMNGGTVRIVYDGDGNRVAKTANGVTTQYLVDNLNPTGYPQMVEEIVNAAAQREYTYGLQRIDEDQVIQGAWVPSFYGYDGFGTVRQLTNVTGAVTDSYEYDAFGNEITHTGTTPNNYLYRGEQFDSDLGLYYLRARYYNPLTGRFMSRDPLNGNIRIPATLHKYLYSGADPVNVEDPSGEGLLDRVVAGILAVGLFTASPEEQAVLPHVEIETEAIFQEAEKILEEVVGGSAPPPPPPQ